MNCNGRTRVNARLAVHTLRGRNRRKKRGVLLATPRQAAFPALTVHPGKVLPWFTAGSHVAPPLAMKAVEVAASARHAEVSACEAEASSMLF